MAYPTSIFRNTPLTCNLCEEKKQNCEFMKHRENFSYANRDPGYRGGWVSRYCTMKEDGLDDFTLYFPYILLLFSLLMVGVERGFSR